MSRIDGTATATVTPINTNSGVQAWYSPSVFGLLPGVTLAPVQDADTMIVADSHQMAVACWRYSNQFLAYYRVVPAEEPVKVATVPGLYRCRRATIIEEVHNGARWSDQRLWQLVERAQWSDGQQIYDENGHLIDPPGMPDEAKVRSAVEKLKREQYVLPALAAKDLAEIRGGWSGKSWPAYAA